MSANTTTSTTTPVVSTSAFWKSAWFTVLVETLLILLVFALHAGWPVPDDNEAHYLTKAKHYWDSSYAQGDFFLESADAHTAFYWLFGWVSLLVSLPTMAWIGRFAAWGLLAYGWQRLSWAVWPRPWVAVVSSALFITLLTQFHMAGEWVVGGIEAKSFAYGFVFLALAAVVQNRWNWALIWLGCASALHVVVGGWAAIAVGCSWLLTPKVERQPLKSLVPGLLGSLALAAIGVWPALMLTTGVEPEVVHEANRIYIHERLPHHLVSSSFRLGFVARHAMLATLLVVLCTLVPCDAGQHRLRRCVLAAIAIAALGYAMSGINDMVSNPAVQQTLNAVQRYYWFRLSDAFVPLGVALVGLWAILWTAGSRPRAALFWLAAVLLFASFSTINRASEVWTAPVPRGEKNVAYQDWLEVCDWLNQNAAADAMLLGPRTASSLTWHTGRPEVVNWKNVPQDAPAIVQWWERVNRVHGSPDPQSSSKFVSSLMYQTPEHLQEVIDEYQVDYLIVNKPADETRLEAWPAAMENKSYVIYAVTP